MTPAAADLLRALWSLTAVLIGRPELAQMAPLIPVITVLLLVTAYLWALAVGAPQREESRRAQPAG